jgi:hypothetical protein
MGKYKKYAKTEQSLERPNKVSENNSNTSNFNQSNKTKNKKLEFNNKNELYKLNNGNNIKADENSLSEILWEIWDAMKYFLLMCKDFLIPSGLPFKIFGSFVILELIYQGIIIYIINHVLSALSKYFSIWQKTTNMYIYAISYAQMFYIFICEGLLIFRFIHFKVFIFQKINWLINILTCIIIILNTISINELNNKIYRFYGKNSDMNLLNNKIIRDNIVNEYINLYVNKDDDFEQYELCYEMKFNDVLFQKIKNKILNYQWHFDMNSNLYILCKNFSILNKPIYGKEYKPNSLFNCQNKFDTNNAPNYCVSTKYRQKRFYAHLKIAFFEIIILILWNLYNYFSIKFIYHYFPTIKSNGKSNLCRQNNFINTDKNMYKNNINKTVTYKDINDVKDGEVYESDNTEEEEENEPEEYDGNGRKGQDNKNDNVKEFKVRKISKKKWKTYKKKRKNRYNKEEKIKNKNKYFDEGILSKDFYEKNEDNNDDSSDKNDDEDEDYLKINKNDFIKNEANEKEEEDDDDEDEEDDDEEEEEDDDEEEEEDDNDNYMVKRNKLDEIRKMYLKKVRKYQYAEIVYNFLIGNYIRWIKDKFHQILLDLDRDLIDKDE